MRRMVAITMGLVVAGLPASVGAQEGLSEIGGGVTSFGAGDWFGLLARLVLVVGVIWVAVLGMRWYVRRVNGGMAGRSGGALEVLETHALGPNRALHLVRLGDRAVLIGATPERITSLLSVEDTEELRRLTDRPEPALRGVRAGSLAGLFSTLPGPSALLASLGGRFSRILGFRGRSAGRPQAPMVSVADTRAGLPGARDALERTRRRQGVADERSARPSLFDRTLAAAGSEGPESVGAEPAVARGMRARTGYGRSTWSGGGQPSRNDRIEELQRAIAYARRNVG